MINIAYNKLNKENNFSTKEYCLYFISLFNHCHDLKLLELDEVEKLLKLNNGDIFPETINIREYFNDGNINFIISYIYHFLNINKEWFDFDEEYLNKSEIDTYSILLNNNHPLSLFKHTFFLPEILLSQDTLNRQLTFLFFLFMPLFRDGSVFFHYITSIPLLCYIKITDKNFDTILFLMKKIIPNEMNLINNNKNMNHLLIENFMETADDLLSFKNNVDFKSILPVYKIYKLLDENYTFKNFDSLMLSKYKSMFSDIYITLTHLEKEYFYNKLNATLTTKILIENKNIKI